MEDMQGHLVSSEDRAETLPECLKKVQWAVRPLEPVLEYSNLGPGLEVGLGDISDNEVAKAASKLKVRKAAGNDDLPPELWKHICTKGSKVC